MRFVSICVSKSIYMYLALSLGVCLMGPYVFLYNSITNSMFNSMPFYIILWHFRSSEIILCHTNLYSAVLFHTMTLLDLLSQSMPSYFVLRLLGIALLYVILCNTMLYFIYTSYAASYVSLPVSYLVSDRILSFI